MRGTAGTSGTRARTPVGACAGLLLALLAAPAVAHEAQDETASRAWIEAWHVHGITPEVVAALGPRDEPLLRRLVLDPAFTRRDNAVPLLGELGGPEAAATLGDLLADWPAPRWTPEEDRAFLLVPHALARLSERGDASAARLLARLREPASPGALLGDLPPGAPRRADALADLAERAAEAAHPERTADESEGASSGAGAPPAAPAKALDGSATLDGFGMTYANHAAVPAPLRMTDTELDAVLAESTIRMGRDDPPDGAIEDLGCCVRLLREGSGLEYGARRDGLDSVDDLFELSMTLRNPVARVKVVRLLNYCQGRAPNILGCATPGEPSIVLVRTSHPGAEAVLWVHETGHDLGLGHDSASGRNLMHPVITGDENLMP